MKNHYIFQNKRFSEKSGICMFANFCNVWLNETQLEDPPPLLHPVSSYVVWEAVDVEELLHTEM